MSRQYLAYDLHERAQQALKDSDFRRAAALFEAAASEALTAEGAEVLREKASYCADRAEQQRGDQ